MDYWTKLRRDQLKLHVEKLSEKHKNHVELTIKVLGLSLFRKKTTTISL